MRGWAYCTGAVVAASAASCHPLAQVARRALTSGRSASCSSAEQVPCGTFETSSRRTVSVRPLAS